MTKGKLTHFLQCCTTVPSTKFGLTMILNEEKYSLLDALSFKDVFMKNPDVRAKITRAQGK